MNIYESIIEDVKAERAKTDAKTVLTRYKKYVEDIRKKVVHTHSQYQKALETLHNGGYSADYIQEFEQKERGKYEESVAKGIEADIKKMADELETLRLETRVNTGDKAVSANNLLKLQAILPGMSLEDKESLFSYVAKRDPNILEVLYFNVKKESPALAERIKESLDMYTGQAQILLVENQYRQLKGLGTYLNFDSVKSMGNGFAQIEGAELTIEGTVDRILEAFIQGLDKAILKLEGLGD